MAEKDYEVGHGKPPKHTRFKKGQSGNPKGRPKGTKNLATDLAEELRERLVVTENGQRRRVSKQRAMLKSLTAKAIKGDVQATNTILRTIERVVADDDDVEQDPGLAPDDQEIIQLFLERKSLKEENGDE